MFPSPLGEVGSLISWEESDEYGVWLFPSPLGEVGSLIGCRGAYGIRTLRVSVPSRGSGFLNKMNNVEDIKVKVSVPSRGSGFLNLLLVIDTMRKSKFPSPLGEVGSLILNINVERVRFFRFRPLSGKWVP